MPVSQDNYTLHFAHTPPHLGGFLFFNLTKTVLKISVGIENQEDMLADLNQALEQV